MKLLVNAVASVAIAAVSFAALAMTATPGTKEDAKVLAERAAEHIKKVGYEQASKDFTTDQGTWGLTSRDRLAYVYIYDYSGKSIAHAVNPAVVGKDLLDIKDPDGKTPIADSVAKAKAGGGFVDFRWASPVSKKIVHGSSYVIPIPGKNAYVAGHAVLE